MNEEIYQLLLSEIHRLRGEVELEPIFKEYIYDHLTDKEVVEIVKKHHISSIDLPQGLEQSPVLRLTLKLIDNLKKSTSWEEFQEKYTNSNKDPTDFDKLIDQSLKTKPPD